jgi:hypothetical protein
MEDYLYLDELDGRFPVPKKGFDQATQDRNGHTAHKSFSKWISVALQTCCLLLQWCMSSAGVYACWRTQGGMKRWCILLAGGCRVE